MTLVLTECQDVVLFNQVVEIREGDKYRACDTHVAPRGAFDGKVTLLPGGKAA